MAQRYPGKRYHATEPPRYVQNEAEDLALGPDWRDSTKPVAKAPRPTKPAKD